MKNLKEFHNWLVNENNEIYSSFSVGDLKNISTNTPNIAQSVINRLEAYLKRRLGDPVGEGQYRIVWKINETQIIKLAKNIEATKQNEEEIKNSKCIGEVYAVKVLDYEPNFFYWVIEENLIVPKEGIDNFFRKVLKMPISSKELDTIFFIGVLAEKQGTANFSKKAISIVSNYHNKLYSWNEWYTGLIDKLVKCKIDANDLHYENWGIRLGTETPVILDLGF